jgi:RNA polymerase sigma factor (sigma-70 family)
MSDSKNSSPASVPGPCQGALTLWDEPFRNPQTLSSDPRRTFLIDLEKTHGRGLRRFLSSRVRIGADVPDLVQEIFLRLLRVEHHEAIRNPQAYLYTIASHVLSQHALRSAATDEVLRFSNLVADLRGSLDSDPAAEVETEQLFEELVRDLERDAPRAYATLVLHRYHGLELKEIAPRLGVSYNMVKRYLAQALTFCQQRLADRE